MNWIILIIAGLFESGFAFCLGKMKMVTGTEYYLWGALPGLDWNRCGRHGAARYLFPARTRLVCPPFLYYDANCIDYRTQNGVKPSSL